MNDSANKGLGFVSSVAVLSVGAFIVQVITVVASPFISRLFKPEAFGVAGAFTGIMMMLAPAATLSYGGSILLPKEDEQSANSFLLTFSLSLVMTGLVAVPVILFGEKIFTLIGRSELAPFALLVPLGMLFWGTAAPFYGWAMRKKRFFSMATSQVLSALFRSGLCLGLGVYAMAAARDLVVARMVGAAVVPVFLALVMLRKDIPTIFTAADFGEMIRLARRYKRFPLFSFPNLLLTSSTIHLPVLIMVAFFGKQAGGYYSYAVMLLSVPIALFGQTVGQAFFPHAAHASAHGAGLSPLVSKVLTRMLKLGAVPFAFLMVIGPEIFAVYLGKNWFESGYYAAILVPMLFLMFVGGPVNGLYAILEKQAQGLAFTLATLGAYTIGFLVGRAYLSPRQTLALVSFLCSGVALFRIAWICRQAGVPGKDLAAMFSGAIIRAVPFVAVVAIAKYVINVRVIVLFGVTAVTGAAYLCMLLYRDSDLRQELMKMLPEWMKKAGPQKSSKVD